MGRKFAFFSETDRQSGKRGTAPAKCALALRSAHIYQYQMTNILVKEGADVVELKLLLGDWHYGANFDFGKSGESKYKPISGRR